MSSKDTLRHIESEDLEFGPMVEELDSILLEPGDVFPERLREIVRILGMDLPRHFDLEERALFPVLLRRIPRGPVDVLRQDHATARGLLATLAEALRRGHPAEARTASAALVALLRKHMEEEHRVLFPTAFRMLTPTDRSDLDQAVRLLELAGSPARHPEREPESRRLDVRGMPAWERPEALSRAFRALPVGQTLAVRTHEEPSALRAPFEIEWAGAFEWSERRGDHEEWTVELRKLAEVSLPRAPVALDRAPGRCLCG